MSAVDERVVRMEFDNKQFEKNIRESIKSLDDLDKQLGLVGEEDAFDNIDKSSKKIDFSNMLGGLSDLTKGFTALEAIALGALARIGSKIADVVTKYAGFFTFQQIGAGWQKFAEYSTAAQSTMSAISDTWEQQSLDSTRRDFLRQLTKDADEAEKIWEVISQNDLTSVTGKKYDRMAKQMANSLGMEKDALIEVYNAVQDVENAYQSSEEYVEKFIDQLNWYSDETSYNFTDMISTLGKFTAAGQELEESTIAIQGMMNMVATAGGNAEVGQRVAYNLSQAMSAGSLKMIDWKSLQNANVATVEFKQKLIDTAVELGTVTKMTDKAGNVMYKYGNQTFSATENFEASLAKGWANSKVLQKTLKAYGKFSDQMYKLTENEDFEDADLSATKIFGDLDAYEAYLEGGEGSDAADEWHRRMQDNFGNDAEAVAKYREELDKMINDPDYDFGKKVFGDAQKARTFKDAIDATADAVSTKWALMFKYIFGTSERAKEFWSGFTETLYTLFAEPLDNILSLFRKVKRDYKLLVENDKGKIEEIDAFEAFRRSLENLQTALLGIITPIRAAFSAVFGEGAAEKIVNLAQRFYDFSKSLLISKETGEKITETFTGFFSIFKGIGSILGGLIKDAFNFIKPIFGLIKPIFGVITSIGAAFGRVVNNLKKIITFNRQINNAVKFGKKLKGETTIIEKAVGWISDKLGKFSDWIDKTFSDEEIFTAFLKASNAIRNTWTGIKKAFSDVWNIIKPMLPTWEQISGAFSTLWSTVKKFLPSWNDIVAGFSAAWTLIKQVGGAIWEFLQPYVEKLGQALGNFWSKLSGWMQGFIEAEDKIQYLKDTVNNIIDAFKQWKEESEVFKTIRDAFNSVKDAITDFFDSLPEGTGGKIASILFLVTCFVLLFKASQIADDFTWYVGKIGKAMNKFARMTQFVGLYLLIRSITDLTRSLQDFSKVTNPQQVYIGMGFVILLLGALIVVAYLLKRITKDMTKADMGAFAGVIAVLALALLAIAKSLEIVGNVNMDGLLLKVIGIVVLLAALVGAAYLLTKFVKKINWKVILSFVAVPLALFIAAAAFAMLGKLSPQEFNQAFSVILLFTGALILIISISALLKGAAAVISSLGNTIFKVALGFLAIALALRVLQGVKMDSSMIGTIFVILGILAVMAIIPLVVARLSKRLGSLAWDMSIVKKSISAMVVGMLGITASILLIAYAMNNFGLSSDDIVKIGLTLLMLMAGLAVIMFAMGYATELATDRGVNPNKMKKTSKTLIKIVVAVAAMAGILALLAYFDLGLDNNKTQDVLGTLAVLVAMLAGLMLFAGLMTGLATGFGKNKDFSAKPIIAIVLSILAMAGILMLLAKNDLGIDKAGPVLLTIGIMIAMLAILMLAAGRANDLANSWGGKFRTGPLLGAILAITAIAFTLLTLSTLGNEAEMQAAAWAMLTMAGAIAAIIFVMGIMSEILNRREAKGGGAKKAATLIASIALLIVAIAGAMYVMSLALTNISGIEGSTKQMWSLMGIIAVLGLVCAGIAVVVNKWGGGAKNIYAVSVMVLAIAAAMYIMTAALSALSGASGLEESIDIMWKLFGMLLVLSIVLGAFGAMSTSAVGLLGASVLIVAIAGAFLILAAAMYVAGKALPDLSSGLAMLFNVIQNSDLSLAQIGLFALFSIALIIFAGACLTVSFAAISLAAAFYIAGAGLKGIAEGLNELGPAMENFHTSGERMKEFTKMLAKFGGAGILVGIACVVIGVGLILVAAAILIAAAAALVLAVAFLIAVAALVVLTIIIHALTDGLQYFANGLYSIAGIMPVVSEVAGQLAIIFIKLGFSSMILGVGLIFVGAGLLLIATAAFIFSAALSVSVLAISALAAAIGLMAKGIAVLSDVFTGGDTASKVDSYTKELEEGGNKISETLKNVKEEMSDAAGGGGDKFDLSNLIDFDMDSIKEKFLGGFTGEGGIMSGLFGGEGGLQEMFSGGFTDSLIGGMEGGIDGVDPGMLDELMSGKFSSIDSSSWINQEAIGTGLSEGALEGISQADFTGAGETATTNFAGGIKNKAMSARRAGYSVGSDGKQGAESTKIQWGTTGQTIADHLIQGILAKLQAAFDAGKRLAEEAKKGADAGADNGSPSKVMMKVGKFMSEGLAIGIEDNTFLVEEASKNLALDGIGEATRLIADAIENDYSSPVIRPVLDLSNVAAGASQIGSMFGRQSVGVDGQYGDETATRKGGATYNYIQNNYSPKALNRIEIYRQTKNQINASNLFAKV